MAISSSGYHNQNQVISKIQSALEGMLTDLNITGWQVLRSNQPTIQAVQNDSVYYDIVSKRRIGTQGTRSLITDGDWQDNTIWYEEFLVQVSGFKQRDPDTDTVNTLSSSDVISLLQGCINANGVLDGKNYFGESWIQLIKSTSIREIDYETDSGLKEKMPQFDFLVVVEQSLSKAINRVDDIDMNTYRV